MTLSMDAYVVTLMFKKLQLRLTVYLCVFITIIMVALCAIYIYITSSNLNNRDRMEYKNNIASFYAYLSGTDIIDYSTISEFTNKGFYVELIGNTSTQRYGTSIPEGVQVLSALNMTARPEFWENYYSASRQKSTLHSEFTFQYESVKYRVSYATIYSPDKIYSTVLLYSTQDECAEISQLCLVFLFVSLGATMILYIISYFFVGKVLIPVKEAHDKQEEFIAFASHELRSPLTVIKTTLSAMSKSKASDFAHYKSIADAECARMTDLINDMLVLAKIKKDVNRDTFDESDPTDIIITCYNRFEELAFNKGLAFHVSLPEQPLQSCRLDKDRIIQLIIILLDNAISYTESGTITLAAYEEHGKLRISVSDTGIGISDADKKRIFDKFYSVNPSHSQNNHYGLGLNIAKEIAAMHKASIKVTDNAGGGSVFTILFP